MNNNIRIKCFIRLDQTMMDLLLPKVIVGHHVEKHWMFWTIPVRELTGEVAQWLEAQPKDSWARVSYTNMFEQLMLNEQGDRIAIGISLSDISPEQIRMLIDSRKAMSIITCSIDESYSRTKNPHIYTDPLKNGMTTYMYVKKGTGLPETAKPIIPVYRAPQDLVEKFMASLEGHDFFYEYSDSLSVWKAGKADEQRLKAEGVAMGIPEDEVNRLYDKKYKELTKR